MKIAFLKVPALAPYYFDLIYDIQDGFYFHVSYCYFHTHTGAHTQTHTYFWSWMSGRRWMHWYIYKYFSEYPYWYISVLCNVTLVGEGFPVGLLQACRHCSCNIGPFFHADLLKSFDFFRLSTPLTDFQLGWRPRSGENCPELFSDVFSVRWILLEICFPIPDTINQRRFLQHTKSGQKWSDAFHPTMLVVWICFLWPCF